VEPASAHKIPLVIPPPVTNE